MAELLVEFISSLDAYASAVGRPGYCGLQGPEYLAWLDQSPERHYTAMMGATTYRLMSERRSVDLNCGRSVRASRNLVSGVSRPNPARPRLRCHRLPGCLVLVMRASTG